MKYKIARARVDLEIAGTKVNWRGARVIIARDKDTVLFVNQE